MRAAILTVSDKGSRGDREDRSGAAIREIVEKMGGEVVEYSVVPDEQDHIETARHNHPRRHSRSHARGY
jgi:molybdopterin biosynthesis enzyme MoaB